MNKLTAFFEFEEETSPVGSIVGPFFLLLAIALALKVPSAFNYDLLFVAIFGLFLTAKWKIRGCVAALLLLAFSAGAKHVLFPENHAWQAGLEGSIGIALFISALVFEGNSKWAFAKQSELERNEKTILFLEDDLRQQKELAVKESAAALEKLANLRLQLEELESQVFTLQVLNDVLRKTAAKSIQEKEEAVAQARTFDRREGQLLEEIDSLQTELNRLGNDSVLVQQNKQLFDELNESRVCEAEMHLIHETLVRLHAKENQKAREFEVKFFEMAEQTEKISLEKVNAENSLESMRAERDLLVESVRIMEDQVQQASIQKVNDDRALEDAQVERNELHEEIERLRQKPAFPTEDKEILMAQLHVHQTRLEQYRQVDLLYRQLKAQFEEKNEILHQTRAQLFHADTELQTIKQKLQEKDLESNPMSKEVYLEIDEMEEENSILQQENQDLQDLVSHLMQRDDSLLSVKKKRKKSLLFSNEQATLF